MGVLDAFLRQILILVFLAGIGFYAPPAEAMGCGPAQISHDCPDCWTHDAAPAADTREGRAPLPREHNCVNPAVNRSLTESEAAARGPPPRV